MILRNPPGPFGLFFVMQGSVVPQIAPQIGFFILFCAVILMIDRHLLTLPHLPLAPLSVFGVALSLFLGFRNNAAYGRWWEARSLWGRLVGELRALSRDCIVFFGNEEDRRRTLDLARAFVHLHRGGLRRVDVSADCARWLGPEEAGRLAASNGPACAALNKIASHLHAAAEDGRLDGYGRRALAARLGEIANAQAGCERIAATPLPFVYSLLVRRTACLYCLVAPFGLIETTGLMAPLFAGVIAYVFFGLAAVTDELEHPFRDRPNGLPLDSLCRTVEISIAEGLGDQPPPLLASRGNLLT